MRSRTLASVLPLLVASIAFAGCAAPAEDDTDDATQDVTGGSSSIESPVAFLFEAAAVDGAPKCAGAMLSNTMAVTAKSCAKEGLLIGRATDKDGRGERAKIKAVHLPEAADADIAVVELDKPLKGTNAVITHMPLRAGYAVNAFAATDGKGLLTPFAPEKNEASTVTATMTEETSTHGSIIPVKGTEICDGDVGAPVCSTTAFKVPIAGYNIYGTCGLSALVVGRMVAATPTAPVPGAKPAAPDPKADPKTSCSGGAWKVVQLGQHHEFLAKFAPKAFQPLVIDKPILRLLPGYAPEGLWGYKSKGDVKACTLDAAKLEAVKPGVATPKLTAKVSFAGMDKKAAPWGRFGIAPKAKPTEMRWLPAQKIDNTSGTAFDAKFEGAVGSDVIGDYVVAFRASGNGGETWTTCDTDGIENGYSVEKALTLSVADATTPPPGSTPPPSSTPSSETPPSDPLPTDGESTDDSSNGSSDPLPEDEPKKKDKAAKDDSGCSMSRTSPLSSSSTLPIVGVLLGLGALLRRRRQS
jgi:Trypsin